MRLLKHIQNAKDEADNGTLTKAKTLLDMAESDAVDILRAICAAKKHLDNGDPTECVSALDLVIRNQS